MGIYTLLHVFTCRTDVAVLSRMKPSIHFSDKMTWPDLRLTLDHLRQKRRSMMDMIYYNIYMYYYGILDGHKKRLGAKKGSKKSKPISDDVKPKDSPPL